MADATEPAIEIDADVNTIADLPFHMMGRFPKPLAIGRCRGEDIVWLSSRDVFERIRDLSLGIRTLGVSGGDRVAIIAESRPEWLLCDLAVLAAGAVTVPIHDVREFRRLVRRARIRIAVIAVPAEAAQSVVNTVVAAGVKAVLNFSPGTLKVPPDVKLKSVDLTVSLESLSFFLAQGDLDG